MKNNQPISFVFYLIRNIIKSLKCNHLKIKKIEKNNKTKEYIITFFAVRKRQLFVKSTLDIIKNDDLINQFSPEDAAKIGFYTAQSYSEKIC